MSQPLATISQRFTSQFVDSLAALAMGVVFYLVAKALSLPLELALLGWLFYLLLCDGLHGGQSLGKRFTKTAVVHVSTEKPCTYWQSFVRNFAMVFSVFDAIFIIGKHRRRLGDYLACTKVVLSPSVKSKSE